MSAENDKFEKMDIAYELLRFIDLMVRQNCRRAHYEHLTRTRPSKEDRDNIYATDNLKKVYDKPRENIYQLLKVSFQFTTTLINNQFLIVKFLNY